MGTVLTKEVFVVKGLIHAKSAMTFLYLIIILSRTARACSMEAADSP